ncbi:MAG: hypothetical protein VB092_08325 [Oscillospiraceae bacterium]|nr:hypothetical protein [Oscillospiraceae bacterium]
MDVPYRSGPVSHVLFIRGLASEDDVYPQARLTEDEENILNLMYSGSDFRFFDIYVDDAVKSMMVNVYELDAGAWKSLGNGAAHSIEGGRARFVISGGDEAHLRTAVQTADSMSAAVHSVPLVNHFEDMGYSAYFLSEQVEIECGVEIPVAIWAYSVGGSLRNYAPDYGFKNPQEYVASDYKLVCAVTIPFSQDVCE